MTERRHRRRDDQSTIQVRLAAWAEQLRAQAEQLPPGAERDALLAKADQADTTANLDHWLRGH